MRECPACGNPEPEYIKVCPWCENDKCDACDMGDNCSCSSCEGDE